jgi:nicotinamidase/pyrazinamidase
MCPAWFIEAPTETGAILINKEINSMKKKKKILMVIAAIVLCILCFVGAMIGSLVSLSLPTMGEQISSYENPQKALLVIDIQEDFTGTTTRFPYPYKNSEHMINTVNTLTEDAINKGIAVIYIRQEFSGLWGKIISSVTSTLVSGKSSKGSALEGTPGVQIDQRIVKRSDYEFPKSKADAFSNPDLEALLVELQVNELYLVGLDAEYCVFNTAQGALNRGYTVHIITDAVALGHEEIWDDLLQKYQDAGISLLTSEQFLEQ